MALLNDILIEDEETVFSTCIRLEMLYGDETFYLKENK